MRNFRGWTASILALAAIKAGLGIVAYMVVRSTPPTTNQSLSALDLSFVQVLVFGTVGAFLIYRGKADPGAVSLGAFFLMIASRFAGRPLGRLDAVTHAWLEPVSFLWDFNFDEAFFPLFLWLFVHHFPETRASFRIERWIRWGIRIAAVTGVLFMTLGTLRVWKGFLDSSETSRFADSTFWMLVEKASAFQLPWVALLMIAASIVLTFKIRRSFGNEKRRGHLFALALILACGPVTLDILIEASSPAYNRFLNSRPALSNARIWIDNLLLLTVPSATAYSVLVHQALGVRLIARKTLQYAMARSTMLVLLTAPFLWLCTLLYQRRHLSLTELVVGQDVRWLLAALLPGILAFKYRGWFMAAVDRHFFREQYNARRLLTELVDQIRGTRNLPELSNLVCRGLDHALHLEGSALLVDNPALGQLVDPRHHSRPLDPGSRLATLVRSHAQPLDVDLNAPTSPLRNLPDRELHWLMDGKVRLMTPIFASDGGLLGILALGSKKSEQPFLREDRQLLMDIGSAAGLVLELLRLKEQSPPKPLGSSVPSAPPNEPTFSEVAKARECPGCTLVYPPDHGPCPTCDLELDDTSVPYMLRRMFRFEQRIGTGGMAVVYRATDLKLGRAVAIKTLPRVSADHVIRLHHEARAAASVSHPGLAAIYGIETWEGIPMLILEWLEGGTLAERIQRGNLGAEDVVRTGQAVALALAGIHTEGILHRDIKPSNIGFTRDGTVKLLDFGIAHMHHDLRMDSEAEGDDEPVGSEAARTVIARWEQVHTATGQVAGTLPYMSPQAVDGAPPDPSFDLWSLCVVLFEALTGENLFRGRDLNRVLDDIRQARVPDIRQLVKECPPALAGFFERNLSRRRAARAPSGQDLHDQLEIVHGELTH